MNALLDIPDRPLVTASWLAARLDDPQLCIVDIRGRVLPPSEPLPHYFSHRKAYDEAHIPSAVFIDWVNDLTDPDDPRRAQIAKPERYAALMGGLGIGDETFVVAYDDAGGMFAARLWWSLLYYGHTRAAVMIDGWQGWLAAGYPTTAHVPAVAPALFTPRPDARVYRDSGQVMSGLLTEQTLIDVRTPHEFTGQSSRARRRGHIPGAINLPRTTLLNADGQLADAATLRQQLGAIGITESTPDVVFYCNGGVSASFGLLAMRAAGLEGGAVYDGSWKDWGNDDARPIEP